MHYNAILFPLFYIHLWTMSACSQKTPISQELFETFAHYAKLSAIAYASDCPTPPDRVVITKRLNNAETDTQGFIARDSDARDVIVAFRGTSDLQDFRIDLKDDLVPFETQGATICAGCMVHDGFLQAWNSIANETIASVQAELRNNPNIKLNIIGHSLGGSLAALATMSMLSSGLHNITTYTFGQPRTGNQAFADFVDKKAPAGVMFRVTHSNDGVPQVETTEKGFRHHSTEYWQENKPVAAEIYRCTGQEPHDCNNSVRGTGIGAGGVGINAAHVNYLGISIGNPLIPGEKLCHGKTLK